jgi:hypothetical protein
MANSSFVRVYLVIVSTLKRLVAEEVDCGVVDARNVSLRLDVSEAVGFIPPSGEDVEGDLASDREAI